MLAIECFYRSSYCFNYLKPKTNKPVFEQEWGKK